MGFHTYDLAKFDLSAVGHHDCYVYLFTQVPSAIPFVAERIGENAVSITNGVQDADWRFLPSNAPGLSPHAFWYATILVICPSRLIAEEFLSVFKKRRVSKLTGGRKQEFCDWDKMFVISVPRGHAHDMVLSVVTDLISAGVAQKYIESDDITGFSRLIELRTSVKMHVHKNAIIAQTIDIFERTQEDTDLETVMTEIKNLRKDLTSVKEHDKAQQLYRELNDLRELIQRHLSGNQGLSVQVSAGLEAFGNGIRFLYKTNPVTKERIAKIQRLLKSKDQRNAEA